MKTIIFDGRKYATEKEPTLAIRVLGLKTRGVYPKLATILIGSDAGSVFYTNLKKKAAERIGAELDVYTLRENEKLDDIILLIDSLNTDPTVCGIMIQMPLPERMEDWRDEIVNTIDPKKDVDGLRDDSPFLHSTAKAIIQVVGLAAKGLPRDLSKCTFVVVGATGMVGTPLVKALKDESYKVISCNTKTLDLGAETLKGDVLISATGKTGIIKADMVKKGAMVIDVGYPKGDVEEAAGLIASFLSPVPGGIGPVTITCLLENLLDAC